MIEALVAILIFSLGVLAMVGTGAVSVNAQSDAQFRSTASQLAEQLAQSIYMGVDLTSSSTVAASLPQFAHQTTTGGTCNFTGTASSSTIVTDWITKVQATLPNTSASMIQVSISPTNFNAVNILLCWQGAGDLGVRQHNYTAYIN